MGNIVFNFDTMRCRKCGLDRDKSDFYRDNRYKNEVRFKSPCKQCQRKTNSEWQRRNPDKARAKSLRHYYNHPSSHIKWRKENPEKAKECYRKWWRNHPEKSDPRRYLDCCMRSGIRSALKGQKAGRSWELLVGYTVDDLMNHLERQFQKGMLWENYGEWHIDHKIPKSVFNYSCAEDIDFKRCWSIENLRPLWAKENMSKQDKLYYPFQPCLKLRI